MMKSKNHTIQICLAPELRSAIIKYMGKHDLDKEYAALCLICKALRSEGLLDEETYQYFLARYSKPVLAMSERTIAKPLSLEQLKEQQVLAEKTRYFQAILAGEWAAHPSVEWRRKVLALAAQWQDRVPQAKLVLELGQ